jgi:hypothetical protein
VKEGVSVWSSWVATHNKKGLTRFHQRDALLEDYMTGHILVSFDLVSEIQEAGGCDGRRTPTKERGRRGSRG